MCCGAGLLAGAELLASWNRRTRAAASMSLMELTPLSVLRPLPACLPLQLPNRFNFAFDYYWACWLVVLAYLPGGCGRGGGGGIAVGAVCVCAVSWMPLFT